MIELDLGADARERERLGLGAVDSSGGDQVGEEDPSPLGVRAGGRVRTNALAPLGRGMLLEALTESSSAH